MAEPVTASDNMAVEVQIEDSGVKDVPQSEEAGVPAVLETNTFDSEATSDANEDDSSESETSDLEGTIPNELPANNRSTEVHGLFERFQAYKEKIDHLVHALNAEYATLTQLIANRVLVTAKVAALAQGTVIEDKVGKVPMVDEVPIEAQDASYSVIQAFMSKNYKMYHGNFKKDILDYAVEWDTLVTNKVTIAIAKNDELEKKFLHYEQKVASLHSNAHRFGVLGKELKGKKTDKLKRNEGKLLRARIEYETFATRLCDFLDEVTIGGWKDLYLLLIKLSEFNLSRAADDNKALHDLESVVMSLKATAIENGAGAESRLNDLEAMYPDISVPHSPMKPGKGKSALKLVSSFK